MPNPIPARYRAAMRDAGGGCPIEAGVLGRLAEHECALGRLPGDRSKKCGCWPHRPRDRASQRTTHRSAAREAARRLRSPG